MRACALLCYNPAMKIIVLAAALFLPALAYAAPSIAFEADTRDFGKVMQGEVLEHTFVFVNTGADELHIERVSTS